MDPVGLDPVLILAYGFLSLFPLYGIVVLARWLKRRAAFRDFAVGHQLRFRGTLPSDKSAPYTAFPIVRRAVLLGLVMEGHWTDFDVALFTYRRSRFQASDIGVIVSLPNDCTSFHIAAPAFSSSGAAWATRVTLDASGLASWVVLSELIPGSAAAAIGPRTAALLRDGPPVSLETNLGYLFVTPLRGITPDRLPDVLDFATSVARALGVDAHTRSPAPAE